MTKFSKIIFISFIVLFISITLVPSFVLAVENNSTETTTTVSSVSSIIENNLDISDILNILLIAIGIVIILLAIAILIRLKK